ncbi:MAG: NAD-dependent epimerase/dehydratase family protein, partial [Myxococcota bacterium]
MPAVTASQGPVTVTGASGYVGSHVVLALLQRGFEVRACVTDTGKAEKTAHLLAMNEAGHSGRVSLHQANLLEEGSYDEALAGCAGLLHAGTAMGYGGANQPQEVYDGAVDGTRNVMGSAARAGTVRRVIYTSSFSAIVHPAPAGYVFTEADWASDGRVGDPSWSLEDLNEKGETGYAMAKEETEKALYRM